MLFLIFLLNFYRFHELVRCVEQADHVPELSIRDPFVKAVSPILIQASSFEQLVEQSTVFFDRSLFIKKIIELDSNILIITLPSGFGKTMNLGMIQAFFEIQVDDDGNTIEPRNQTTHYRLFKNGEVVHRRKSQEKLKSPSLIATLHENFTDTYLGTHPVVYICFSSPRGDTFDQVVSDMKQRISHVYEEFYHLLGAFRKILNDPENTKEEKEKAERNIEIFKKHAFKRSTLEETQNSLAFLCDALYENYKKEVILLVDDYDAILNHTLYSDKFFSARDEDLIIEFFKGFVSSSVANTKAIKKAIFSGSILLKQDALMPALNNSKEYSIWDNELANFYACEDNFTELVLQQIGVKKFSRDMIRAVRLGYRLNVKSSQLFYDPLTLACTSGTCLVPRPYALFVGKFLFVESFRNAFSGLISMYPLNLNMSEVHFDRDDFKVLKIPPKNESSFGPFVKAALKYLYVTGFLTLTNTSTETELLFKFPCETIHTLMKHQLMTYYVENFNIHSDILSTRFSLISAEFYDFSRNFETNRTELESLLSKFYTTLLDPARITHPNEETIRDSVNFLIIFFEKFKRIVTYGPEIALFSDDYVLMIVEPTFDEHSAHEAVKRARNRWQTFRKYDNFNMFKFVGVNVRRNGTVHVLGENKFYRELAE